ncbi:hypothetical protein ACHAWC_010743 [Mediolabrus comicus]
MPNKPPNLQLASLHLPLHILRSFITASNAKKMVEIHRRKASSSNDGIENGDTTSSSTKRNGGGSSFSLRSKQHTRPGNPYSAASQTTTTDIILFRSLQILLVIATCWFISLIFSVNSPAAAVNGDGLRGSGSTVVTQPDPKDIANARDQISKVRDEFYTRYGGKSEALDMLKRGLYTFEKEQSEKNKNMSSVRSTAERYLRSIRRFEENQSSSSSSLLQAEFVMAFGGYSVTVGRGNHFEQSYPFIMEKILSPILSLPPLGVKLIVRNSAIGGIPSFPYGWCLPNFLGDDADAVSWDYGMNEGRGAAGLESYVRQSLMLPKSPPMFILLDMKRPRLDLLQKYVKVALNVMEQDPKWRENITLNEPNRNLPAPVTDVSKTGAASILHGIPNHDSSTWRMHRVSCRTSFLPNMFGNLDSIIESGVTKNEDDMLKSRDDSLFIGGWVMDVGQVERETKLKVQKYGGLGYIDMKTALYGIPSSGTLKLWLPYEISATKPVQSTGDVQARTYFNSVVLCEVNEKRGDKECSMISDLAFRVGGTLVSKADITQINTVASYLKKDICIRLEIPKEAKLSARGEEYGLPVDIAVSRADVSRENGACSLSHVIWEHND